MKEREEIIAELWYRLSLVPGVVSTARNPSIVPDPQQMPCIQFFELEDTVEQVAMRGGCPVYHRQLTVAIEPFVLAQSEQASTAELISFVKELKKSLYAGGPTLGNRCLVKEVEASRILRPPGGTTLTGVGIAIVISYVEDTSKL